MSHPHEVPQGWRKGESLDWWQAGDLYAVRQSDPGSGLSIVNGQRINPENVAYITFDSLADMNAFLQWWCE